MNIMKRLLIFLVSSSLVFLCTACQKSELSELPIDGGCTVLYATDGEQALGGGNGDWWFNPFARIWFLPGENGDFGRVYLGFENFSPQGGMNDQGLFFDGMMVDQPIDVPKNGKESEVSLFDRIMRECSTVDCAIEYFDTYHMIDTWNFHFLIGDAFGNSVIIEPLNVIRMEGNYQVGTNFYQADMDLESAGCWRYRKATEKLENVTDLSVEYIRDVLNSVHYEHFAHTLYSYVYDLKGQVIYLYNLHDYENVVIIDLSDELAKGAHAYKLASLFPENPEWEQLAKKSFEKYELLIESNIDSSISPTIYDAYVGTYLLPDKMVPEALRMGVDAVWSGDQNMSVIADGISLWLTFPGGSQYEFFPKSETSFFYVDSFERDIMFEVIFDAGKDGKATQLEFVYGDTIFTCERLSDDIIHDLIPILQTENGMVKDEIAAADPQWIGLIIAIVLLLCGRGMAFVLRSREQ